MQYTVIQKISAQKSSRVIIIHVDCSQSM